jgi:hypothetical protein
MTQPADNLTTRAVAAQNRRRKEALTALTLIVLGAFMIVAALTVIWTMMVGLLGLGVITLVLGVLLGLNN